MNLQGELNSVNLGGAEQEENISVCGQYDYLDLKEVEAQNL